MIRTVLKERIANNSMIPFMVKNEDTKQAVKQTMQLEGFFPTPIGFVQMDKTLNKKILEINKIKQFKFRKNFGGGGNDVSSDLYILDKDELSDIKKVLTDSVNEYFKEIVNPDKDMKLYITNSWINVNKNGESHHAHKHTNSIVSSVLYIDTHEGDTITFLNPNDNLFGNLKIGNNTTMWDSNEWTIPTKNNILIMFPSTLTHAVSARPNTCTGTRISLSFNTWFKGTIGCGEGSPDQLCL
jgi:uncharacterized protein (TIGR02466 family)